LSPSVWMCIMADVFCNDSGLWVREFRVQEIQ
jgi:hypothetical protein